MKPIKTLSIETQWHFLMGKMKIKSELMVNYNGEIALLIQEDKKVY